MNARLILILFLLAILLALFVPRPPKHAPTGELTASASAQQSRGASANAITGLAGWRRRHGPSEEISAETMVAQMVNHFGRNRRELARAAGIKAGKEMPPEVEKFFDAIEAGNWDEIERLWTELRKRSGRYEGTTADLQIDPFWPAILDAYGVAEQAHMWPADKLLDYGYAILDSLKPGMVYMGGTDPGRWIPEMINESMGADAHVIITQNALADSTYMEFVNQLYGDRMATLTKEDSTRIFNDYVADAQKRFEHDRDFPDEPKQVKGDEEIQMVDGKIQVGGKAVVMAINEKLFQELMAKNPEMSFGIEQSFPFKSTYENAAIIGPIMAVNAGPEALTAQDAGDAVNYWRQRSEELSGADGLKDEKLRMAYGKLAADQAALLLARDFAPEAEQTYRLATEMSPTSPEALYGYANFLTVRGRGPEAIPAVERAIAANPEKQEFRKLLGDLKSLK